MNKKRKVTIDLAIIDLLLLVVAFAISNIFMYYVSFILMLGIVMYTLVYVIRNYKNLVEESKITINLAVVIFACIVIYGILAYFISA